MTTNQSKEEGSFSGGATFAAEFLKFYPELAQLVNACKQDWQGQGSWSEWDQSVYQRFIALGAKAQASIQPCPCFDKDGARISPCFRDRALSSQPKAADESRDAARYRWLREQDWFDGALCVLRDPKKVLTRGSGLGADCPSRDRLDAAIDAALSSQSEAR